MDLDIEENEGLNFKTLRVYFLCYRYYYQYKVLSPITQYGDLRVDFYWDIFEQIADFSPEPSLVFSSILQNFKNQFEQFYVFRIFKN